MIAQTIEEICKTCDGQLYIPFLENENVRSHYENQENQESRENKGNIFSAQQLDKCSQEYRALIQKKICVATTDSRQELKQGLFIALCGERVDGHSYVRQAAENGCDVAIVERFVEDGLIPQIKVDSSVLALGKLAAHNLVVRRKQRSPFLVVAITGSVGKTTTKDFTARLLSLGGPTIWPQDSFNNEIGLPLTVLKVDSMTRFLVTEMGANHMGELTYLAQLVKPDIAIELKVGVAHVGEFGSPQKVFEAKSELVQSLAPQNIALLNANDELVRKMASLTQAHVKYFGIEDSSTASENNISSSHAAQRNSSDPLFASASTIFCDEEDRPTFQLIFEGKVAGTVHLHIPGKHTVVNAIAAAAAAHCAGISSSRIIKGLESIVEISPHRMDIREIEAQGVNFTIIDDTFNANPDSMNAALDVVRRWKNREKSTYIGAVLGPMFELGDNGAQFHYEIGKSAYLAGVDTLICVGTGDKEAQELVDAYERGARDCAKAITSTQLASRLASSRNRPLKIISVNNPDQALQAIIHVAHEHPHAVILLKGSHASGLSGVADKIIQKNRK